jgi:hypothetical protein
MFVSEFVFLVISFMDSSLSGDRFGFFVLGLEEPIFFLDVCCYSFSFWVYWEISG